jgi:hypothetical protein
MSRLFFFILILNRIHGEYLSNADSSSFIVLRHIRLLTDNEHYRIQCPYNLNYLTLQLLNYSNENCFNLYSTSNNNICRNHHSPCQFHTKSVQLHCHHHHPSYSNHVDITYQCSYKYIKEILFDIQNCFDLISDQQFLLLFFIQILRIRKKTLLCS